MNPIDQKLLQIYETSGEDSLRTIICAAGGVAAVGSGIAIHQFGFAEAGGEYRQLSDKIVELQTTVAGLENAQAILRTSEGNRFPQITREITTRKTEIAATEKQLPTYSADADQIASVGGGVLVGGIVMTIMSKQIRSRLKRANLLR